MTAARTWPPGPEGARVQFAEQECGHGCCPVLCRVVGVVDHRGLLFQVPSQKRSLQRTPELQSISVRHTVPSFTAPLPHTLPVSVPHSL